MLTPRKVRSVLEDCGLTSGNFVLHYDKDDTILNAFRRVYDYCANQDYYMAMGSLYHFLGTLSKKELKSSESTLSSGELYFRKIVDYISANYFNDISVQSIADEFNIDRTYIFKLFKKHLNTSPKQYIMNFRIDRACDLLRKSHLDITATGFAVGFNSPPYFSKQFSLKMGITPLKYRRQFIEAGMQKGHYANVY
ncbi:helix-turn-helix domain-containing protein [Anaerobium acetethylicum]|nr:AraC family transcriptional regulator [Anaerobium acetethylicum]